ncbi:MAG: FKBP-type peptidyl-prolyl cis-trans isomerase [Victivallales bacterium]|nr:FKBP-type peptidyl-prolyl cis-trans isomerase [Victivallales bacterium]
MNFTNDDQKYSYCLGLDFGVRLAHLPMKFDEAAFREAVQTILSGKRPDISQTDFEAAMNELFAKVDAQKKAKQAGDAKAKAEGEAYLAENAKKPGVTVTASGLQIQVLTEGTGRSPKATDTVRVHYEGTLINGKVFDSSYARKQPIDFPLNQVIPGWTEGLQHAKIGGKLRLVIPSDLAYGKQGAGADIPPDSTLIFTVELLNIL